MEFIKIFQVEDFQDQADVLTLEHCRGQIVANNFLYEDLLAHLLREFEPPELEMPVYCGPGLRGLAECFQVGVDVQRFGGGEDLHRIAVSQFPCYGRPDSVDDRSLAVVAEFGMDTVGKIKHDASLG